MKNKTFYIKTLGCKLNFSESATLERLLTEHGYVLCKEETADVDIYIVNSCAVTGNAEKKCRQFIHHVRKQYPEAKIILTGCFSSLDNASVIASEVDLMSDNKNKMRLVNKIDALFDADYKPETIQDVAENDFFSAYSVHERTRSFLKIQDGCDYFCSYCTVAYARGRSRSDSIENIVRLAGEIASQHVKEIVLTGVNIGDFKTKKGEHLLDLLLALQKIENLSRIRISSIEPNLLTDDIINLVAHSDKILPHFHIPLQSGVNEILAKMKRRYPRELFAEKVHTIKEKIPSACIAADVIVGFPGETDLLFDETYQFIESLPISMLHVFPYSKRPGTIAASMENHVDKSSKTQRANQLTTLSEQKRAIFYRENYGKTSKALIESKTEDNFLSGFTENYIRIKLPFHVSLINEIKLVQIQKMDKDHICHAQTIDE
ncbi:MAG: tRNA (N(6)-L-threonylcarbamoyladenosine(37)-C(2))-methylthiotransferase MtaB [Bacteroidales bacterium]|jgi:threonylcarbamoyladenosine tRNA methylthiotransferase MtaB|nr:tRNA (N(6)-L-threonylcarbamoyladenosine(37)-C(2))-methylthiotransferase MtaB [Bacteroidales bacterium]